MSQSTNTFEGYVLKAWMKYVSAYTNTSMSEALRNLADYLEKDGSMSKIHGGYLSDMRKFLGRLANSTIKVRALNDLGLIIPDEYSKAESIKLYLEAFVKKTEEYNFE